MFYGVDDVDDLSTDAHDVWCVIIYFFCFVGVSMCFDDASMVLRAVLPARFYTNTTTTMMYLCVWFLQRLGSMDKS